MKCKKCAVEIDDTKVYCDQCKKELNLSEKLEDTKELDDLSNLVDVKNDNVIDIREALKDIVDIEELEKDIDTKEGNKWIIITFIAMLIIMIAAGIVIFFNFYKKEEVNEEPSTINYEIVIKEYGDNVVSVINEYLKENNDIPSWSNVRNLINYEEHNVICGIHNIYEDGNVYLDECKVDDKRVSYSYGNYKEIIKEGKKLEIYKENSKNNYSIEPLDNYNLIGSVTCKTDSCEFINGYNKFALIREEDEYYIYNCEADSMEFGPFKTLGIDYNNDILSYDGKLYGVLYKEDGKLNIYNVNKEKTLKDIKGNLLNFNDLLNSSIMYKYGYAIFNNDGKNNFINLNTGNISYSITGEINSFVENLNKDLVYITTYNSSNSKITIYNSNGKKMFSGKEFNDMTLSNTDIIVYSDNVYYIYNSDLKLKLTSKEYEEILDITDSYVVVVDNGYLELVNLEDNILATYELKWDSTYKLNKELSGKVIEDNKEIIYIMIESGNSYLKYYYDTVTKEFGIK